MSRYPLWLRCAGYGAGAAVVAAVFAEPIFALAVLVLPLNVSTYEQWADRPPVGALCTGVGVLFAVFVAGLELGARGKRGG